MLLESRQRFLSSARSAPGFTLLEMLVVLVIIGLLAGLVGPRLFSKVDSSKVKTAQTQIKMIKGSVETMRLDIGRFPTTEEGLKILYRRPANAQIANLWQGPYLDEEVPLDPWNKPYQYQRVDAGDRPFYLFSFGADGVPGGEKFNKDLGYVHE